MGSRATRGAMTLALCGMLSLGSAPAFGALDKCQKRIEGEGAKLQKAIYTALQKCKDAIQKERVKGIVTGLGTGCLPGGGGCMPNAAKLCETQLAGVYDVLNAKPGKAKTDKFRSAIEKARESGECTDADLDISTGLGHLLSGSGGHAAAPPNTGVACDVDGDGHSDPNCAGKFMVDWYLFAIEKVVIKQQLFQVPEFLSLIREAAESGPGPLSLSGTASKKATSCSAAPDIATEEFRPNLCRFGVECRDHACTLDSSGTCAVSLLPCDAVTQAPCTGYPNMCIPTYSYVSLESEPLDFTLGLGPLRVGIGGRLVTEICRPGRITGTCKVGGAPCSTDGDCGLNAPCNMFPGLGAGAAFGSEPEFLYLINEPSRTLTSPIPPIPIPPFSGLVDSACVEVQRSEGWCDCVTGGSTAKVNLTTCQDHITGDNVGTDDCTAPISAGQNDSEFDGTVSGALTLTSSGASVAGDCVDLLTVSLKLLTSPSDRGPDGLPCTDDDYVAPIAPLTVPATTGTAQSFIKDAVSAQGTCAGGPNIGSPCIEDANCPASTCSGESLNPTFTQGSIAGSKTNCNNYIASNLSNLALVGATPILNAAAPLGDSTAVIRLKCK